MRVFLAPVLEESVYRLFVCVPLVPLIGCRSTIIASGILFGLLLVLYGNPSPENLFGGFFLAWAYLKSKSIVVPLLLHGIGNGVVVASQIAGWYFMHQPI